MKNSVNNHLLELFSSVLVDDKSMELGILFSEEYGVAYPKISQEVEDQIFRHLDLKKTKGQDLNKTFLESWVQVDFVNRKILANDINSFLSMEEKLLSKGSIIYVPKVKLDLDYEFTSPISIISIVTKEEAIEKSLDLLESGIALKSETIDSILKVLELLEYKFLSVDSIKNKEALIKVISKTGVYPTSATELLRFIVYKATGQTLLIKSREVLDLIKSSSNPTIVLNALNSIDEIKLAEVFNRYKPIFLSLKKSRCDSKLKSKINRISKLSKKHHKPIGIDVLNLVTVKKVSLEDLEKRCEDATVFQIFRALNAVYSRVSTFRTVFTYQIRNGKTFTKKYEPKDRDSNQEYLDENLENLMNIIKSKFNFQGEKIYIPENISYSVPTSEKSYIGNLPLGTKIKGDNLVTGIYWENSWGSRDLDLSGIGLSKIGWDSKYSGEGLKYSGDVTDASNGAVEFLYSDGGVLDLPTLVLNNVYSGSRTSGFNIIVANKPDHKVKRNDMRLLDPDNIVVNVNTTSKNSGTCLGLLIPKDYPEDKMSFVLINSPVSNRRISSESDEVSINLKLALYEQYTSVMYLEDLLRYLGAEITNELDLEDENLINLDYKSLQKDTLINLFK